MPHLPRLVAPLSAVTAALAIAAPAADAASSHTFPASGTTVEIIDPGPAHDTVHMTVTSDGSHALADTKVFLGGDTTTPYHVVGTDGIHDARYAPDVDELSTGACAVYDGPELVADAPVTVAGASFSVDLPKGEVIAFESTGVEVGVIGVDAPCAGPADYQGLAVDYTNDHTTLDGFSWDAPAAPVVSASGGARQVTLTFDRERGTTYDVYSVVNGTRSATPVLANLRGAGTAVPVVLDQDDAGQALEPGTTYAYEVQATRIFNIADGSPDGLWPTSPFSVTASATTAARQTVRFDSGPAATTTERSAQFSWTIDANPAGDAPFCVLDATEMSGTEVPCTTTGASVSGLTLGAHTLTVYPADGEGAYPYRWTVSAPPAVTPVTPVTPTLTPTAPTTPTSDRDGDGIQNTWLISGRPAPAPARPKAAVTGGNVRLTLKRAPKGAKHLRVYRADGKGKMKAIKTLKPKAKSFTDTRVRPGHTYTYKIVAVNAKGQQSAASRPTTAKVGKRPKKHR